MSCGSSSRLACGRRRVRTGSGVPGDGNANGSPAFKRCVACERTLPVEEFNKRGKRLQSYCRGCQKSHQTLWKGRTDYNRRLRTERQRTGYNKRYAASRGGIIRSLISLRGYPREEAEVLADVLLDPETRCAICGIPNKMLRTLYRAHFSFPWGRPEQNRRLTPDNLTPGQPHRLASTRILCLGCNTFRGPARHTDEQVLAWARDQWRFRLPNRYLGWLR